MDFQGNFLKILETLRVLTNFRKIAQTLKKYRKNLKKFWNIFQEQKKNCYSLFSDNFKILPENNTEILRKFLRE